MGLPIMVSFMRSKPFCFSLLPLFPSVNLSLFLCFLGFGFFWFCVSPPLFSIRKGVLVTHQRSYPPQRLQPPCLFSFRIYTASTAHFLSTDPQLPRSLFDLLSCLSFFPSYPSPGTLRKRSAQSNKIPTNLNPP